MKVTKKQWLKLLNKTVNENNWVGLHKRFSENSLLRNLIDTVDYVLDQKNKVGNDNEVAKSIYRNLGAWKSIRESAAVIFVKEGAPTKYDVKLFLEMFIREQKLGVFKDNSKEASHYLLEIMADIFKKYNEPDNHINTLEQAFGLELTVGKKNNPFEVPDYITRIVNNLIEGGALGLTEHKAITTEKAFAEKNKLPMHDNKYYQRHLEKYKWAALNDYLHSKGHGALIEGVKIDAVFSYWGIQLPNNLKIHQTFMKYGIGKLSVSSVKVIKGDKKLN